MLLSVLWALPEIIKLEGVSGNSKFEVGWGEVWVVRQSVCSWLLKWGSPGSKPLTCGSYVTLGGVSHTQPVSSEKVN